MTICDTHKSAKEWDITEWDWLKPYNGMTLNNNTLQYGKVWQFESEKFGQTDSWIVKEEIPQ